MLGFLKKVFAGGEAEDAELELDAVEHDGFRIVPTPRREAQGYRVCARIEKEIDGELKSYQFVRADVYVGQEDTLAVILQKAKRLIHEQGDGLFEQ